MTYYEAKEPKGRCDTIDWVSRMCGPAFSSTKKFTFAGRIQFLGRVRQEVSTVVQD